MLKILFRSHPYDFLETLHDIAGAGTHKLFWATSHFKYLQYFSLSMNLLLSTLSLCSLLNRPDLFCQSSEAHAISEALLDWTIFPVRSNHAFEKFNQLILWHLFSSQKYPLALFLWWLSLESMEGLVFSNFKLLQQTLLDDQNCAWL